MSKNKRPHIAFLLIMTIAFLIVLAWRLFNDDVVNVSETKQSQAPLSLEDIRSTLYDGVDVFSDGFSVQKEPVFSKEIRSEALPRYVSLRLDQIKNDYIKMEETGEPPIGRKLGIDLSYANLQNTHISYFDLSSINFSSSNFKDAELLNLIFVRSTFDYADFRNANLSDSKFQGASLLGVDMTGANLESIVWDDNTVFFMANISNVVNASEKFKKFALENGALELSREQWLAHVSVFLSSVKDAK